MGQFQNPPAPSVDEFNEAITNLNAHIAEKLNISDFTNAIGSNVYVRGLQNIGSASNTIVLTSTGSEATYLIVGGSSSNVIEAMVVQRWAGNGGAHVNFGNTSPTPTYNGNVTSIKVGTWFRGIILSSYSFTVSTANT